MVLHGFAWFCMGSGGYWSSKQRHVLMLEWEDWRDQLPKQLLPEPCTNQAPWWRQFEEMMLTAFKEQLLTFCGVEWDTRWQVRAK